jgi:tryptophan synthase beta chain
MAYAMKKAPEMKNDSIIIVNLSGRGDKDLGIVSSHLEKGAKPQSKKGFSVQ